MDKPEEKLSAYLSKIALLITAISVLTFAIGCYIINTNLATYQIQDFDLVKPRAVITGFVYLLLLGTNVSLFLIIPFNVLEANSKKSKHINFSSIKLSIIAYTIFLFLEYDMAFNPLVVFKAIDCGFNIKICIWILFYMSRIIQIILISSKRKKGTLIIFGILANLAGLYLFVLYINLIPFIVIFGLEFLIFIVTTLYFEILINARDREIYKIGKKPIDDIIGLKEHPINELGVMSKKIMFDFRKKHARLSKFAFLFIGIVAFLFITAVYSRMFYPKFSQSFGGGKLEPIAYVVANDTIKGKKVYETENFVFVLNPDTSITKLDWKDIKKILKKREK